MVRRIKKKSDCLTDIDRASNRIMQQNVIKMVLWGIFLSQAPTVLKPFCKIALL
jgi:hypothetical protein